MTSNFSKLANATISNEQFDKLFKAYKNGDKQAFETLVNGNVALVLKIAHDYKFACYEDVVSEGVIGLMKAIENYNPEKGRFSQYASRYINKYICMYLNKDKAVKTKRYERMSEEEKQESNNVVSLNEKVKDGEEKEFGETLADESESHVAVAERKDLVATIMEGIDKVLDAREQIIIRGLYGLNGERQTLEKVAGKLNIIRERARQIAVASLEKLKEYAER